MIEHDLINFIPGCMLHFVGKLYTSLPFFRGGGGGGGEDLLSKFLSTVRHVHI